MVCAPSHAPHPESPVTIRMPLARSGTSICFRAQDATDLRRRSVLDAAAMRSPSPLKSPDTNIKREYRLPACQHEAERDSTHQTPKQNRTTFRRWMSLQHACIKEMTCRFHQVYCPTLVEGRIAMLRLRVDTPSRSGLSTLRSPLTCYRGPSCPVWVRGPWRAPRNLIQDVSLVLDCISHL